MSALAHGKYALAIKYLKTAEKARPGRQYATELASVRAARRRSVDVASNRERMMGGEPNAVVLDDEGNVLSGHRTVLALPGESLWSIAAEVVAAREGVLPSELEPRDADVYTLWDTLTDMNGLRELEVGERVMLPLSDDERAAMARENAEDMERIHLASAALESRDLEKARSLRAGIHGAFALASDDCREFDLRVNEAGPYTLDEDGTIVARKPAGVPYTEFARTTVEWFIARRLVASGAEYPNSSDKTEDDVAWADYMKDASSLAGVEGTDFSELLADSGERSVRLPNPGSYFK